MLVKTLKPSSLKNSKAKKFLRNIVTNYEIIVNNFKYIFYGI